jgi:hypothetical protein
LISNSNTDAAKCKILWDGATQPFKGHKDMAGEIKAANTGFGRFINTLLGLFLIIFGFIAISERQFWSSKYQSNIDLGPFHVYYGIGVTIIGSAYLIATWRKRKPDPKDKPTPTDGAG